MYGIYANIWGILMVNVTIYVIHTDPMGMLKECEVPHSTGWWLVYLSEKYESQLG